MDHHAWANSPCLNLLSRNIREYSLFQGVLLVMEQTREAYPSYRTGALQPGSYSRPTRAMGFFRAATSSGRVFSASAAKSELACELNADQPVRARSPLPAVPNANRPRGYRGRQPDTRVS